MNISILFLPYYFIYISIWVCEFNLCKYIIHHLHVYCTIYSIQKICNQKPNQYKIWNWVHPKKTRFFPWAIRTYFEKLSDPSTHHSSFWDSDVFHEIICIENDNQLELMEEKLTTDKSYKNQVVCTWLIYYNWNILFVL